MTSVVEIHTRIPEQREVVAFCLLLCGTFKNWHVKSIIVYSHFYVQLHAILVSGSSRMYIWIWPLKNIHLFRNNVPIITFDLTKDF